MLSEKQFFYQFIWVSGDTVGIPGAVIASKDVSEPVL